MPLPSGIVGSATDAYVVPVDARWTMAHAAALGDVDPCYLDTTAPAGIVAHPLFVVGPEWPVVLASRSLVPREVLPADEAARGVHATHDVIVHRLVRPGDLLRTTAVVEGVERRRPGAYEVLRLETTAGDGEPVATTRMGSLFLGVEVDGPDRPAPDPAAADPAATPAAGAAGILPGSSPEADGGGPTLVDVPIAANAAHVYTEGAHIWNPIHTDLAVARAAGLPGIILHGTATLAHAVSEVVRVVAGGDPHRVGRITGRFGAMVLMPSVVTVAIGAPLAVSDRTAGAGSTTPELVVPFEVRTADGQAAVRNGTVHLRPAGATGTRP